jgi:molybdate transport system ATP-binding protein
MSDFNDLQLRMQLTRQDFQLAVDVYLPASGITVLFGPSGSGKTTLLRCVAGLERPQQALIRVGADVWQDDSQNVFTPTWQRDLGFVFQEASLFEHLDVQQNLQFGLQRSHKNGSEAALASSIELLGIAHLLKRQTHNLSGGERQRVAIARALATQPKLLLLDEPLASLDMARRHEILPWLEKMRDELKLPMLYVTHSVDEVVRLADHLVVLDQGHVTTQGAAQEVLTRTSNPAIVGDDVGVLLTCTVERMDSQWHLAKVAFEGGHMWVRDTNMHVGKIVRLRVLARDVSITLHAAQHTSIQNHMSARIETIHADAHPSQALVRLQCGATPVLARVTQRAVAELGLAVGMRVWVQVKSVAVIE